MESDRPAIFNYITNRFGKDKTSRVASFGTLADKSVIDEVGRALMFRWNLSHGRKKDDKGKDNPYCYDNIARIKKEYAENPEEAKQNHQEIFYFFDGLRDVKVSQSVHPAGMVISPITLPDNYGVFDKDGEICLMLDMDNVHNYTGLAKYDFLVLKTVQVIRDTCRYIGVPYPKTHEIDWNDEAVWDSMVRSPSGIFQFEGAFAFESLKKFRPKSIFDMSLVTACIRPTGASYRDKLLNRQPNKNPSPMIDDLLSDSLHYLVYQEQTIAFLQKICGLSGSEADNIRRAIGRKQKDRLDKAMPSILEGYCSKSDQPREVAEKEAKEFLQIIEDSASYQFGYNHSIAYCLLGYLCAYYRHYYPLEFLTSFLNNAANDDDIANGTHYAHSVGIKVTLPKWGISRSTFFFDKEKNIIAKGLSSVKYIGEKVGEELYTLSQQKHYDSFIDLLTDLNAKTSLDTRQLDILIKIDFFSDFGNQRELFRIAEIFYNTFKCGEAKKIAKEKVDDTPLGEIIRTYSVSTTKSGGEAKSYTITDMTAILHETEKLILSLGLNDLDDLLKVRNFTEVMGYAGYVSGKEEDRPKLLVKKVFPARRKRDNAVFGYNVYTQSIGSGIESCFTIFNNLYELEPVKEDDVILCKSYVKKGQYFTMTSYSHLY